MPLHKKTATDTGLHRSFRNLLLSFSIFNLEKKDVNQLEIKEMLEKTTTTKEQR